MNRKRKEVPIMAELLDKIKEILTKLGEFIRSLIAKITGAVEPADEETTA